MPAILAPDYNHEPSAGKDRKSGPWLMIGLVIIATAVAVWLVPGEQQPTAQKAAGPAPSLLNPISEQRTAPNAPTAATASNTDTTRPPPQAPGDAARALIRQLRAQPQPNLQQAYDSATRYRQQGDATDAYLLYFYAARAGYGPAALALARQSDPATFKPNGLFDKPDELQAYKWYRKAEQAGMKSTIPALAALRKRVEQQAAAGDQQAQRIMLQWK